MYEYTVYVVQKCWFEGPHVEPAVDFQMLFTQQAAAEAVAHQSAHLLAHRHGTVVRTLMLQPHNMYAFCAAGSLFWVRQVAATVTDPQADAAMHAHVVITHGVVGGTGNVHSRRGSEINTGRVFLGAQAQQYAFQAYQTQLDASCKTLSSSTAWPLAAEVPQDLAPYWQRWPLGGSTSILPTLDTNQLPDNKHGMTLLREERPTKRSRRPPPDECTSPARRVSVTS